MILYRVKTISEYKFSNLEIGALSAERQERLIKIKSDDEKLRVALSEILVREVAKEILGISDHDIFFATGDGGKPFIVGHPDFHYNVSHSGKFVVCAYGDSPVGVDIQEKRPQDMRVAKRYFSIDEFKQLEKIDDDTDQRDRFYELWTKKEAYAKLQGISVFHTLGVSLPEGSEICFNPLDIHPHYSGHTCVRS
ncbi:MAG: 4'-phosphopantetheinyl transferase superfamily protein [bacterium]|nr:4'-phosphopantetheinyl transferase superfamily protein [bacterium]